MKMSYSDEDLLELAENANEFLVDTLDIVIKEYAEQVTLKQMRCVREKVFYTVFADFIETNEAQGNSFDFEQMGKLSYYIHSNFQSTWLEYTH